MMMPPDPLRQKMLFRTEWKTIGAHGTDAGQLSEQVNAALHQLTRDGYNVSQIMPLPYDALHVGGAGMLVVGQRMVSPVTDPTPEGVPVPGTNAVQNIEVIYSFVVNGNVLTDNMPSLSAAVHQASLDLASQERQPISIHVTSVTAYGPGDLSVLKERFR